MLDALIFSTFLFLGIVAFSVRQGRVSLANPFVLYLLFHFISYLWRAWRIWLWPDLAMYPWMKINPTEEEQIRALMACNLGLLAFWVGYGLQPRKIVERLRLHPVPVNRQVVLLVGGAIAVLAAYYLRGHLGGEVRMLKLRTGHRVLVGTTHYLTNAPQYAGSIGILWAGLFGLRPWVVAYLGAYFLSCLIRGGRRWAFVLGALAVMFVDMWRRGRHWPRASWLIAGLLVFLLFGIIGASRQAIREIVQGQKPPQTLLEYVKEAPLEAESNFGTFENVVYVTKFVPRVSGAYSYGTQYLMLFMLPIPRVLWPQKPIRTSSIDLQAFGNFFGLTTTVIGDLYLSLGWYAVAVGMGLIGLVLRTVHSLYLRHRQVSWVGILYSLFLALLPQFYRDGGITIFSFMFIFIGPAAFTLWLASGTKERPFWRQRWISFGARQTAAEAVAPDSAYSAPPPESS